MAIEHNALSSDRVASIDVFRGLTILTMIFVNDVAGVRNIPWWMEHFPPEGSGMTFVDLVFPAFLFIVGMSIPFAMNKRKQKGDSAFGLWKHILIRTAGLLTLGIFMVNMHGFNEAFAGMSRTVWELLVFIAAILVWNVYPSSTLKEKVRARTLRWAGLAVLLGLAVIYRSGTMPDLHWMHTSYWGILGLIGWAYLTASLVYYFLGAQPAAMMGMLGFFIALFVGDASHALDWPLYYVKQVLAVGPHIGGHAMITTAGMIVSSLFFGAAKEKTPAARIQWIVVFGIMMMAAGYLFWPLYGISKNAATPTWCLFSAAFCCWIFALLYWIIDVKKIVTWANFVKPAGANPLLAYILPDIFYILLSLFGIHILSQYFGEGIVGIMRSLVISLAMVWLTVGLNKIGIRLHL
jgi:heparan-alpha-glucosaminide N-acetyltransferase